MMSNNKILTVSYGTFSCTLEGFEDSFETMKAIAEYFRDLAADDRYFGAEPPQPDAEILARIAEREISRRVEAREQEGRIVLSATGPDAATVTPQTSPGAIVAATAATSVLTPSEVTAASPEADQPADTRESSVSDDYADADEALSQDVATAPLADTSEADVEERPDNEAEADTPAVHEPLAAEDKEPETAEDKEPQTEAGAAAEIEAETEEDTFFEADVVSDGVSDDISVAAENEIALDEPVPAETATEDQMEAEFADDGHADEDQDVLAQMLADIETDTVSDVEEEEHDNADARIEEEIAEEFDIVTDPETEAFFAESATSIDAFEEEIEVGEDTTASEGVMSVPESIAAKLQRIRAVVSQSQDAYEEDEMFEDEHAADKEVDPDLSQFVDVSQHAEDIEDTPDFEDEQTSDAQDTLDEFPEPTSQFGWTTDTEATDADVTRAEDVLEAAAHDIEAAMEADDAIASADDADEEFDDEDVAEMLARFDSDLSEVERASETSDPFANPPVQEMGGATHDDDFGLDRLTARLAETDEEYAEDAHAEQGIVEAASEDESEKSDHDAPMILSSEDMVKPGTDDFDNEPMQARAIKVKRADIDAAIASGDLEETDDEVDSRNTGSSLTKAEEAELSAELAAVESSTVEKEDADDFDKSHKDWMTDEETDGDIEDDLADVEAKDTGAEAETAASGVPVDDDDVSRLMAEAENQMDEPEGSSRRSAFAHLKAAVLAKKVDSGIGKANAEAEGAFRSDLESVVVPRRPAASGEGTKRPDVKRPAPLTLVAEQRVDIDNTPKGPVRPRRIAATQEDVRQDDSGFAKYAEEMGAHGLPDLLEAAASYLSHVEERDHFSRPQLMNKIRQVEGSEFSREDGLRSFGQLLRAGKIKKIRGGRFTATAEIGYHPDQRAAG